MTDTYKKFKKIGRFSDVVRSLTLQQQFVGKDENGVSMYDDSIQPKGKILFFGTTKLHGTNASITWDGETLRAGKRTSYIDSGHMGFHEWVRANEEFLIEAISSVSKEHLERKITVFGEWCGKGVQKKVAVSELEKTFYVFSIFVHDEDYESGGYYLPDYNVAGFQRDSSRNLDNLMMYSRWQVELDLENPQKAADAINHFVEEVDKECPVGKVKNVLGHGEGIVFTNQDKTIWFKAKGASHTTARGAEKKATVDPVKAASVEEFTRTTVTEDRLEQGYALMKESYGYVERKHTGEFLKWVVMDILEEEKNSMESSGLEKKDVTSSLSTAARVWLFNKIDSL